MISRDNKRYMKNVNQLLGAAGHVSSARKRPLPSRAQGALPSSTGGGNSRQQATRSLPRTGKRLAANLSTESGKRVIEWRHYEHIFDVMDNLKYQFPALGYERFFSMFTELFQFYSDCGIHRRENAMNDLASIKDAEIRLVSSFGIDPAYYGRLNEIDLYERILLPIFGAAYGTFERPILEKIIVKGRGITTSFSCNAGLSRLIKWTRVLLTSSPSLTLQANSNGDKAAASPASNYHDQADEDFDSVIADPLLLTESGPTKRRQKSKNSRSPARSALPEAGHSRQNNGVLFVKQEVKRYNAKLKSLEIHSPEPIWCDCCLCSYRIMLVFGDSDEGTDWLAYYRSLTVPTVYINAGVLLGWPLTPEEFSRDFTPARCTDSGDKHQSRSFLAKTIAIYRMGFYKRLYSVHLWIYFIVMWLWNCQRAVHERCSRSMASTNNEAGIGALTAFPIQLIVQKKLRKIFEEVPSLPLAKLLKTRKVIMQYI